MPEVHPTPGPRCQASQRQVVAPAREHIDADADGRITPADPAWTDLRLWSDEDRDRRSQPHELSPLSDRGIVALDLSGETSPRCDARGNCEAERAPMIYRAADGERTRRGALVDVHVRCR